MGCLSFLAVLNLTMRKFLPALALCAVALASTLAVMPGVRAQTGATAPLVPAVPASRTQIQLSFAPVVKKVAPAVVNIYTRKVELKRQRSPLLDDPVWRRFFPDDFAGGGPVRKRVATSLGSGVIVDAGGIIVSNVHVVAGADEIRVVLADRREFDARVVLADPRTDLALLHIDVGEEKLPFLDLAPSESLEVGDLVLAIGNPFGVGQTVTSGIVSGLARTTVGATDFRFFIQTDAAINPGNSGGALVTMDGRLAGINTSIYSRSGGSVGIGFAVPSDMVRTVLAGQKTGGRVRRPWLGFSAQRVTASIAASIGLSRPRGVIVGRIHPASPAVDVLRLGDVVVAVNGLEVDDDQALRFRFATLPVGGNAMLTVIRGGREIAVPVRLMAPPEVPRADAFVIKGRNPLAGATVANLSPAVADVVGLPDNTLGVIVLKVAAKSPARQTGIRPGDVIRAVNTETIDTSRGLRAYLAETEGAPRWRITLERRGRAVTIVTSGER